MTVSQRFGRFSIPFRVPLLFSPRMAQVTAAETSSREEKRCPCMGSFNLGTKSKSGRLYLDCMAREVTLPHSYLLSKSVTTSPRCGRALSCKMSGPSPRKSVFVHISAQFLHPVPIIRCFHTCSTWNSCHDDSSVIINKAYHLLDL